MIWGIIFLLEVLRKLRYWLILRKLVVSVCSVYACWESSRLNWSPDCTRLWYWSLASCFEAILEESFDETAKVVWSWMNQDAGTNMSQCLSILLAFWRWIFSELLFHRILLSLLELPSLISCISSLAIGIFIDKYMFLHSTQEIISTCTLCGAL